MTDVTLLPRRNVVPFHRKGRRPAEPAMERRMSATTAMPDPDRELLDLCARAAEIERQIAAAWAQAMAKGEDADTDDLEDEIGTLNQAIVRLRPATLRGFVAKARRAHKARAGDERPPDEAMDEMLVTAVIVDLVAMETGAD